MSRRVLPLSVLLPLALLVLVTSLAVLQYRWVGAVSIAERDEMRQLLEHRAREFANDFDRELTRTYVAFQTAAERVDPGHPEAFATRFEAWRSASAFPKLVKAVYFAREREGGGHDLRRYDPDARHFEAADWPENLAPVRRQLTATPPRLPAMPSGTQFFAMPGPSLLTEIPAFVLTPRSSFTEAITVKGKDAAARREIEAAAITEQKRRSGTATAEVRTEQWSGVFGVGPADVLRIQLDREYLIVEMDGAFLRESILPALAQKHFPESERYRVAIVDATSTPVLTRNLAAGADGMAQADVTAPFFMLRPDLIHSAGATWMVSTGPGAPTMAARSIQVPATRQFSVVVQSDGPAPAAGAVRFSGWRVQLQHAAGSLDAAVARLRMRNLYLSFGILATLAVSVGLILLNARRSEKLAAQQMHFVATVSHELRTPLAVIRSAAQNLSAGVVQERDQARRYGDLIEAEGRRLTDMVEQVLEYAGLSGQRGPRLSRVPDVGHVVKDAVTSCESLIASEGCEVETTIANDLPAVMADEDAIRRAINNLLTNALKYGADGRWIGIFARRVGPKGREEVQIGVSDRGRGIEAEDLPHLFEPFYRGRQATERQIHGNGLGLSLVQRIAESHGGRVSVRSQPGEGSTFTIHLPVAPPERAAAVGEPVTGGAKL
jgi:signal transduction histidine kinase